MNTIARIAVISALLLGGAARAQDAWLSTGSYRPNQTVWIVNWEVTKPIAPFDDYISDTSYRGFSVEGRNFLKDNLSAGISFSWNRYSQTYDHLSVPITNGTVSGPIFRYADMFAIRGVAHYYLNKTGTLRPYLGAGIGGVWAYSYQQIADLTDSKSNFSFIASPEAGVLYTVASGGTSFGLNGAIRYTYTTAAVGQIQDAQTASVVLGIIVSY